MSNNVIQTSFAAGELSPTLYARVDLAKYHVGAARMLNFFVDYRGGASNRPGLELVGRVFNSSATVRLIPFQFSVIQNYMLEFGDHYMRVIKDGALVLEATKNLSAATNTNPGVFTSNAHGYANGDQLTFAVLGMTQINGKDYFAAAVTANTFQVIDWNGVALNTAGFGAFISGTVARVYKITSPYAAADLALLKFTQSADVMTITHPSYAPYDLTRTSDTGWTFTAVSIGSTISPPAGLPTAVVSPATVGVTDYYYVVTAVDANGQESIASAGAHAPLAIDIRATSGSVQITWAAVVGAVGYNVYKALPVNNGLVVSGALFGYMASTVGNTSTSAVDTNITPDFTVSAPVHTNPLAGNNPGTVTYDQQRKVYAGSNAEPETFWMSRPGQFDNFDVSSPVQPSDAITGTLVSRQVNQIKHMVSMPNGLIMLTSGGAWQVSGVGGVLSPTTIQATPQAYNGAGDIPPLTINYEIIYVQQKGTIVRDLSYSFYTNIYTGSDLSVLSNHLFAGYSLVEWTYAEEPFKIIWAVRSDGVLLALTYLKDQEVFGWSRHNTQGRFKSVASIPEGQEDAVYFVVERVVEGESIQFIERMHTRLMPYGPEDAFFLDCALSTEPVNDSTFPVTPVILSSTGISGVQTITADNVLFDNSYIGLILRMGGAIMTVLTYVDNKNVTVNITRPFTDVDGDYVWPQTVWSVWRNVTTISGLDHLEGKTVAILADGNVVTPQVVTNGAIILSHRASKVHIGLAYTGQLQTLYLDTGDPTIQGKRKNIVALTARVAETRGLKMGQTFDDLTEFKERDLSTIGQPIKLFTGDDRMIIGGGWTTEGQMCLQQDNPLPATILGVIPEVTPGDTGK
jgi:hypothetical protein